MGKGRGRGLASVPSPFYQDLSPWPHHPLWSYLAEMGVGEATAKSGQESWGTQTTYLLPRSLLRCPQVGGGRVCRLGGWGVSTPSALMGLEKQAVCLFGGLPHPCPSQKSMTGD